ncbi:MAG: transposase [Anaerolineae bacterium]|nr:transposase [Anaerolineae bacterium]
MPYDSWKHHRRSIRLNGYDYTHPGAYFITLCTHDRGWLFGDILNEHMRLNGCGEIVQQCWLDIPAHFPHVSLDAFVVMPNHFHGIIIINESVGERRDVVGAQSDVRAQHVAPLPPPSGVTATNVAPGSLGAVVRAFKSAVTKNINRQRDTPAAPVWHRNYYEHIIRDETSFNTIRLYVETNPAQWMQDSLYVSSPNQT